MINWSNYFDKIYCISFIQYTKRRKLVQFELNRVGILNSGIFEWQITYGTESDKLIQNCIYSSFKSFQMYPNVNVSLMLGQYKCMRDAYYNGYERILILEDDVRFLKDLNKVEDILNHRPEDYDIILYDKMVINLPLSFQFEPINDYFDLFLNCWSAACYQLNRKGMEKLMHLIQTMPVAIDIYFQDIPCHLSDCKVCCAHTNMAIQTIFNDADNVKNQFQNIKNYHNHFLLLNIDINQYMLLPDGSPIQYDGYIDSDKKGKIYNHEFKITKDGEVFDFFDDKLLPEVNLFFTIPKEQFINICVFLFSIHLYSDSKYNIYIMLDVDDINPYMQMIKNVPSLNFEKLNITFLSSKDFGLTDINYAKLLIPTIFLNLNKILYLDYNMFMKNRGIEQLYNINLDNYYLAACKDYNINNFDSIFSSENTKESIIFNYLTKFYFSNNMILFNLNKIRKDKKDQEMLNVLLSNLTSENNSQLKNILLKIKQNNKEKYYFHQNILNLNLKDRSLLNFIFRNDVLQINPIFNNTICDTNNLDLNLTDLKTDWNLQNNEEYDSKSVFVKVSKKYKTYFIKPQQNFILTRRQQYLFKYYDQILKTIYFDKLNNVVYQDELSINPNILYLTKNKSQSIDITKPIEPTTINIFLAVTVNQIDKLYPILYSLLKYSQSKFNIYIMLDKQNIQKYYQLFKMYQTDRMTITLMDNKIVLQNLHDSYVNTRNIMPYVKIFTPILFSHLDRILYLDWDVIIQNKGIEWLYNMDFEDKYLIACQDFVEKYSIIKNEANIISVPENFLIEYQIFNLITQDYVNSGILLFNNKKIKEDGKDTQILNILRQEILSSDNLPMLKIIREKYDKIYNEGALCFFQFEEKSLINYLFNNNILVLNPVFNSSDLNISLNKSFPEIFRNKILNDWGYKEKKYINDIIIAHYSGEIKPWNKSLKESDFYSIYQKQIIFKYYDLVKEMKHD